MDELLDRLNRTFANLPLPERSNIIYVSPEYGPMSWYVVRIEAQANTKPGRAALQFMAQNSFI